MLATVQGRNRVGAEEYLFYPTPPRNLVVPSWSGDQSHHFHRRHHRIPKKLPSCKPSNMLIDYPSEDPTGDLITMPTDQPISDPYYLKWGIRYTKFSMRGTHILFIIHII